MRRILLIHGKESRPGGRKHQFLNSIPDLEVTCPDLSDKDLVTRFPIAFEALGKMIGESDQDKIFVIGSSLGAVTALQLISPMCYHYYETPDWFGGLILCAPAFHRMDSIDVAMLTSPAKTVVIHSREDDVIPFSQSKRWCDKQGVKLIEVTDDHRMSADPTLALLADLIAGDLNVT